MNKNKNNYINILVNRVAITFALATTILITLRLLAGELHPIAIVAGLTAIVVFFLIALFSGKNISAKTGAWILLFVLWLALFSGCYAVGDINAPVTVVFTLLPLVAAFLINVRATVFMGIISVLSVIALFMIGNSEYSQSTTLDESELAFFKAAWLIFVIFLVSIMGWFYSKNTELLTEILEEQASTDFLTKLANRRSLNKKLEIEFYRTRRYKNWLTILMIDIDHFKKFNDEEGHVKGDESLILVANCIKNFCQRSTDLVGRYGGEEFMLILPDLEAENARTLAENIRKAIQEINIDCIKPENKHISITIGCLSVCGTDDDDPIELIRKSDKLLYQGKNEGRNRVISDSLISKKSY